MKTYLKNKQGLKAFTLIELLIVIAIIAILAAILMPVLSSARQRADQIYCLNNMHQWGLAFHMYCDDNNDYVPEEGNTGNSIASTGTGNSANNLVYGWYNIIPPEINQEPLVDLYGGNSHPLNPPLPSSHSIFSCPSAQPPLASLGYQVPNPTFSKVYFMYGENNRLCVNWGTRYNANGSPTGVPQTKLINILKPSQTVFMAEENPDATAGSSSVTGGGSSSVSTSQSVVAADFVYPQHMRNTRVNLAMCDGSGILVRTNDCYETQTEADSAQTEWQDSPTIHWYPSPTTPN